MHTSASFAVPMDGTRTQATVLGNLLVLLVLPPAGIVGLLYCWYGYRARREGRYSVANRRYRSASAIARFTLYGVIGVATVGAIFLAMRLRM